MSALKVSALKAPVFYGYSRVPRYRPALPTDYKVRVRYANGQILSDAAPIQTLGPEAELYKKSLLKLPKQFEIYRYVLDEFDDDDAEAISGETPLANRLPMNPFFSKALPLP